MDDRRYTADVIAELQAISLECAVKRLLQSRAWQVVRTAYQSGSDAELLCSLVRYEALRIALKRKEKV